MGILTVTLLGLFFLTRLVLQVKAVQLLCVAISGKPAMGVGLEQHTRRKFPEFRNETR